MNLEYYLSDLLLSGKAVTFQRLQDGLLITMAAQDAHEDRLIYVPTKLMTSDESLIDSVTTFHANYNMERYEGFDA